MEKKQQRTIMAVVITTAFITTFTGSALNLSIPDIGRQFDISAGIAGWLITGYTLAVAAKSIKRRLETAKTTFFYEVRNENHKHCSN